MKVVLIKFCHHPTRPYLVQIMRYGRVSSYETFITKTAAKDWADLNGAGAPQYDLTIPGTIVPPMDRTKPPAKARLVKKR